MKGAVLSQRTKKQKSDIIELLPGWETDSILPLYMLYPKREHLAPRTRLFVEHFKQALSS
ncbi:transcriptional regulator [Vibrio ishigakensis]|uniref:Transcriptional regulator n=1 Tax=Vibrio ishigakensis TaxID=1481914 RepID=A0A0B8QFT7_9VIBR|nr:transcriptional regulator [Vibrio ishigakensis]